jgi:hypothetical protein
MNITGRYVSGTATGILRHLRQDGLSHWTQRSSTMDDTRGVKDADRSGAGGAADAEVRAEAMEIEGEAEAKGGAVAAAMAGEDIGLGVKRCCVGAVYASLSGWHILDSVRVSFLSLFALRSPRRSYL